jgi:hypothetical protein
MAFEGYKRLIGCLDPKILTDMVHFSEELSDEQKNKLYMMIRTGITTLDHQH